MEGRPLAEGLSEQEARIIAGFGRHYGIQFRDADLLKLALTHRSYLTVTGQGPRESNERLEFLGDSVLGLVTSEFLYRAHPTEHEGQLTKTKSLLVSKAILSRRALAMGLGQFVLMSHSEVESGGRQRLSILADAFEAVVGAIYLDQGFEPARQFIVRWLLRDSREIVADKRHTNFKSHLQEFVQSTYRTHPVYRIRSEIGPDHSKQFNVEVMVGRRMLGTGRGRNKKEAEQAAARNALEQVEGPQSPPEPPEKRVTRSVAPTVGGGAVPVEAPGESVDQGRRRRGRRGGRGRRKGVGEMGAGAPYTEEPAAEVAPAVAVPAEPGRIEIAEEEPRSAVEVELPSYEEEEEFEEIGRPEGPLEERRVDPYGFETPGDAPVSTPISEATEPRAAERDTGVAELDEARGPSGGDPTGDEESDEESGTSGPPGPGATEGGTGAAPSYGRRSGRSRKGPRPF